MRWSAVALAGGAGPDPSLLKSKLAYFSRAKPLSADHESCHEKAGGSLMRGAVA